MENKEMANQPLITIGIASYNYAQEMKKALNIIKEQKFTNYEILISDDCSTDNSVEVAREFQKENPHLQIRILTCEKNEGLVANKNKLIQNCRGEYLMICDADDWMAENCLERLADEIKKNRPDRIISQVAHITDDGKIIQTEYIPKCQTKWGWNLHHGSICKVSLLREHNILIQDNPDDVYFTLDVAKYCKSVSSIHETLYFWYVHTNSEGRKGISEKNEKDIINLYENLLKYVTSILESLKEDDIHKNWQDIRELGLVRLKLYYFYLLFLFQNESFNSKLRYYRLFHKMICHMDTDYKNKEYLFYHREPPLRSYAMRAIRLCAFLEKYHLMGIGLLGFHIIGKFKYFDQ